MPRSESFASEEKPLPFGQRVRRPRKNGLRLIAIFNMVDDTKRDRVREIQRMEREESPFKLNSQRLHLTYVLIK